jgi:hypothetical protein
MVLAGLKAVVAGAVQDRAAVAGVVVVAAFLLMTGWVLGVAGVVVLLVPHLGTAGAWRWGRSGGHWPAIDAIPACGPRRGHCGWRPR